ncbi:hypothetical protein [Saccharothrix algeriensis]|uniref:DUF3558 domain-containing protein n=1 Tax=Saccharothrix algeriensis TaxID=173560 RepID=A0A8T8HV24_9PSEU|nr:hypothetical protein [Saccharothrix algeriensis]MBM7813750.1 hypothetical protein [Saccharothrix algeriensis]QTR02209.1 hypothetical protein J7S33_23875 [Saccharothrix algeriensis]
MGARFGLGTTAAAAVAALVACAAQEPAAPPAPPPQIPTIAAPTSASRAAVMTDRELPDDCELIVPVEVVNQRIGREMAGELKQITGIPEPSLGRTAKVDCYYDVGEHQEITSAPLIIGLATYADPPTATERVRDSVQAEREAGGAVTEVDVGPQKGFLISTGDQRLLVGSLGKTTFVTRARAGFVPEEHVRPVLSDLAARSMTPTEGI